MPPRDALGANGLHRPGGQRQPFLRDASGKPVKAQAGAQTPFTPQDLQRGFCAEAPHLTQLPRPGPQETGFLVLEANLYPWLEYRGFTASAGKLFLVSKRHAPHLSDIFRLNFKMESFLHSVSNLILN